jgi:hypothetical protein
MTDPILSVNLLLGIGMIGVTWVIYKILVWDHEEKNSSSFNSSASLDE